MRSGRYPRFEGGQSQSYADGGLVWVDYRVVVDVAVVADSDRFVVVLVDPVERVYGLCGHRKKEKRGGGARSGRGTNPSEAGGTTPLTCAVLIHLHRPVVHFRHGLHLDVVAVAIVFPLPVDVRGEVLRHVVGEIISILHLQDESRVRTRAGRTGRFGTREASEWLTR